ncbi:MAG: serine/threonine protein kinase [Gemmatimonadaceae bacterium]|nr:serine/threonine protein kinase [Gemmatimonadaceae bacterium]
MASPRLSGLFADRYLIERELGHGATAVVYLAHDNKQNREIALKVLSKDLAHALGPERFLREIQVTARLHHPHILPIFDSGEWDGMLYYVMPFVRGESLREKIDRESQLPIEECVRITCEVADALSHAHAQDIVHRDVKPENIMLSDGHALLADFGIARSLGVHTGERLTSSGLIVGTSAYMSPEQAAGEENIDARSDVYSLACVLYEMIAGVQAFTGPTTQSVIAQRFKHTPRPVSTYRPQVPEYIDDVLANALTISPADRYKSVRKFSSDLARSDETIRDRRRSPLRRTIYGRQKAFGFGAAAIVLVSAAAVIANPPGHWSSPFTRGAALDSTKYVVIPFGAGGQVSSRDFEAATGIHRALAKWSGITLADPATITDAVRAQPEMKIDDALDLARKQGAGKLIRVNASLDATLYSVDTRTVITDVSRSDLKDDATAFPTAVTALLSLPGAPKSAESGAGRTTSVTAWRAYGNAHAALARWDLAGARDKFKMAVASDPSFTAARVWSATVAEWIAPRADSGSWQDDAIRSSIAVASLAPRDADLALGLGAMARGDYVHACESYRRVVLADSLDFAGWYGLGECQARDKSVLRSRVSARGRVFRSSSRAALDAYSHAFRLEPRAYDLASLQELQRLFPIAANRLRSGYSTEPPRSIFVAYPSIDHDTLAFLLFPFAELSTHTPPATRNQAIAANLNTLLAFVANWVRSAPKSAKGYEAYAEILEARGEIGESHTALPSASAAVARAIQLSADSVQRMRLAATEFRLRVKRGELPRAQLLADSLLGAVKSNNTDIEEELAGVAALSGRLHISESYVGAFLGSFGTTVPPKVREAANVLLAHALLGDCGPAFKNALANFDRSLQSYVAETDRERVRMSMSSRAMGMSAPCTNNASVLAITGGSDRWIKMEQAAARGEFARVRAMFDTLAIKRRSLLPTDLSPDFTYQEAWVRSAIGDTAGAIKQLDLTLGALPSIPAATLRDPGGAAGLVRAMMLRADLAQKTGDHSIASRYASAVAILWTSADSELQPQVARMKAIASGH